MWSRDDILRAAKRASEEYLRHNQSADINTAVIVDTVARMVLDNASEVAERHGDPEIEYAINGMKDAFNLSDK